MRRALALALAWPAACSDSGGTATARDASAVDAPAATATDLGVVRYDGPTGDALSGCGERSDGERRILSFSGREWWVKASTGQVGPGPNRFSDSADHVWLDERCHLNLRIAFSTGAWRSAEVVALDSLGYGTYAWTTSGPVDRIDRNAVLGLFTWDDDEAFAHREIDVEVARWGVEKNDNAQFVVQPWETDGNMHRFPLDLAGASGAFSFAWRKTEVDFEARAAGGVLDAWSYQGGDIPEPGAETPRINLWLAGGLAPSDGNEVHVVIERFDWSPL